MPEPTVAALEAALASATLDEWLARMPTDSMRTRLRRLLEIDQPLLTRHPASLASVLLARTRDEPELAELHRTWTHEVAQRGRPWIRPLRGLTAPAGLLAELHSGDDLPLTGLHRPRFLTDDVVELVALPVHPDDEAREQRRRERLRWSWRRSEAVIEPEPRVDEPERYPRIERDEQARPVLVRAAGQKPLGLPGFDDGSSSARFSRDGSRLFAYGSGAEWSSGFAAILDPQSLDYVRWVYTEHPVSDIHECEQADLLLLQTHRGLVVWIGQEARHLPILADFASLSPSGAFIVTRGNGLRIWSLAELVRRDDQPPPPGLLTSFAPDGERLVSGRALYDGRSGQHVADLEPTFGNYLAGGPPRPWMHLGTKWLISAHSELQLWRTDRGIPCIAPEPEPNDWFNAFSALAFDRTGERIARLQRSELALRELPSGRLITAVSSDEAAGDSQEWLVALSEDGVRLAARYHEEIEVHTDSGALVRRFTHPIREVEREPGRFLDFFDDEVRMRLRDESSYLRFSRDGLRLASFREEDGWRIWDLEGEGEVRLKTYEAIDDLADFAASRSGDWLVEPGTATVFVHRPSGTRIALPAAGPWIYNPADPRILACDSLHIELC
ncbi:WD40 repeat domain-containing protein [Nannocystis radixulma]|uniref:Uncharacterized protein n=1 Tax=Nannocystis radixulma TaxID=2995305 RepID=A0ABT5B9I1_9BACT|nr:hypothetical protein [Nannocystis radixulma]MDC0669712.1 hypothetical protein [Nannocystis radixulma]